MRFSILSIAMFLSIFSMNSFGAYSDAPSIKVSKLGFVFNLDKTFPQLGNAYRDPSGLIWGDLVLKDNHALQVNFIEADAYCKKIGARLPTNKEWIQLGKYLGAGKWNGYSPLTKDRDAEMLNGLEHFWFWSSSPYWLNPRDFQFIFWGDSGITSDGQKHSDGGAIHCVMNAI